MYDPISMTVVSKKGSMITAEGDNRTVTRNSSFFKNIYPPAVNQGNDESQNSGFVFRSHHPLLKVRMFLVQIH